MDTTINSGTTTEAFPISTFVTTLGKLLLQENQRDWLDMEAVADFCRLHGLQFNGKCPSASELETTLRPFFHPTGEFYAPGINVDGYERRRGWESPFLIRAYPYSAAHQLASSGMRSGVGAESVAPNAKVAKLGIQHQSLNPPISISNDILPIH